MFSASKEVIVISNEKEKVKKENTSVSSKAVKKLPGVKFSLRNKFYLILIPLVVIIILTMSLYFRREETALLTEETLKFSGREIEHLNKTAALSLLPDADNLSLIDALKNLENVSFIKYAYIFDSKNAIVQSYISGKGITEAPESVRNDKITQKALENTKTGRPLITEYTDPDDSSGKIYDLSTPVVHPIYKTQRTGTVRLGFSDRIIRDAVAKITKTISVIAVIFLVLSIAGSLLLARMTIGPVRILSRGAAVIGSGDLDHKIILKSKDELGRLAFEFNEMTDHLKKAKEKEVEARVMEEQLDLAKEIQEGLNPMAFYDRDGIQIKGYTRAKMGVGGDYFDYKDIDDNRVGALISDVSGKGVPASLVMVMIRTVFVSYISKRDVQCSSVVKAINDSLSADFAIDKFATLFFMIFNRETEEIAFANAGHGPLFCYRAALKACTQTQLDGMPIGIDEGAQYKQSKIKLSKGDIILLKTDGITEMRNSSKEEYGQLKLQNLLIENAELNAEEIVNKIIASVDEFRGDIPPHDDMTVLVLKRD